MMISVSHQKISLKDLELPLCLVLKVRLLVIIFFCYFQNTLIVAKRTGKYSPDKFYSRLTHRTQLSMDNEFVKERNSTDAEDKFYKLAGPSMGIGNNPFVHSEVKRSKSPVKFSDETTNAPTGPIDLAALSSRSGKSPQILKKSDVLHSQREIDTYSPECKSVYEMSIAGASLSGRLSPSAFGNISELQSTIGPYGTTIAGSPPKQAVHIPFAQRQSKSQVAAFEMLKKGKKVITIQLSNFVCIFHLLFVLPKDL